MTAADPRLNGRGDLIKVAAAVSILLLVGACGDGGGDGGERPSAIEPTAAAPASAPRSDAGSAPVRSAAGRDLSAADDGAVFTMKVGDSADLVLREPVPREPSVTGDAVELIAVDELTGSGRRQWELRAVAAGEAVVEGEDAGGAFRLTVRVPG